ncbi:UxaA family hydrolase [Parasedimentitalea psychrophila]|uniref:UxaA family hydrolase n=1 Tax=Parasedimentitalea psychrophila TaxID=2997337 RepID=A0A9Y2P130_9RHOB|nr:UxaA family hydrolase [Parasedimentitalea psychrophila]WIY25201.1 UxaA family hydrolase [Parasedimentitalea psychrophila]
MSALMTGWLRNDGRKGIRNTVLVAYLVECAHHVSKKIAREFPETDVQVIGFSGCFPSPYGQDMMEALCTHPNVGAVQLVSLGCENFRKADLVRAIEASGRTVNLITIQQTGGTRSAVDAGRAWVRDTLAALAQIPRVPMEPSELVIGTICGGSDATSGLTGNPAAGRAFDRLVTEGATCIFEETGELIGCEHVMAARASTPALRNELIATVKKAEQYYAAMGYGSFSQGNATGGLSTIEEKSLGAYAKSGDSEICGILRPAERATTGGLYLLDVVPDGAPKFGFPNINDTAEIIELISCGAHAVIFVTGRGSVVGSAISPVLKVCANPDTYARMSEDMDVNAGRILTGDATLSEVGDEIYNKLVALGTGEMTASEDLGHTEFVLTYKNPTQAEPGCQTAT